MGPVYEWPGTIEVNMPLHCCAVSKWYVKCKYEKAYQKKFHGERYVII